MTQLSVFFALVMVREACAIAPDKGDALPVFPKSFPGCSCKWGEPGWTCTGHAVFPKQVQGNACCCCSVQCAKAHRCSDEACLTIGVDQKKELAEEQKRIDELLKGADMLISDDLPGFAVDLGPGQCTKAKILEKCAEKGLVPLCDHTSYATTKQCYSPPGSKFKNRHFSHYTSHRKLMGLGDDSIFYGMCFFANNQFALAPFSAKHFWTNANPNTKLTPWGGGNPQADRNINPTRSQMDQCLKKESRGLGCWRTMCVKEAANR